MGVNLTALVPKQEISFEELQQKKVAVDASQMLYQFLSSIRQPDGTPLMDNAGNVTSHLVGLSTRIPNLIARGLKLCFVFDGTPPKLKQQELAARNRRKAEAREKLATAKEQGDEEAILRYTKQSVSVRGKVMEESREFLTALGIPVILAPSEAEAQAAFLAKQKLVQYVASTDYDALLYQAPLMLRNLTLSSRRKLPSGATITITPEVISLADTLHSLGITQQQLLHLAILVGTDFNPQGVKGIGPKTALKLVKQFPKAKELFSQVKADFDWKEIAATFNHMPVQKEVKLQWSQPDTKKIQRILLEHDFNEERVSAMVEKLENHVQHQSQSALQEWF